MSMVGDYDIDFDDFDIESRRGGWWTYGQKGCKASDHSSRLLHNIWLDILKETSGHLKSCLWWPNLAISIQNTIFSWHSPSGFGASTLPDHKHSILKRYNWKMNLKKSCNKKTF